MRRVDSSALHGRVRLENPLKKTHRRVADQCDAMHLYVHVTIGQLSMLCNSSKLSHATLQTQTPEYIRNRGRTFSTVPGRSIPFVSCGICNNHGKLRWRQSAV